jgi:regulatory protein
MGNKMKVLKNNTEKFPMDYALKLLSIKSYSESSMAQKLIKKGFSTSSISQTIKKLKDLNYINDESYGENMIRVGKLKMVGKMKLAYQMHTKGINSSLINNLLESLYTSEEEKQVAEKALEKKKPVLIKFKEDRIIYKKKLYDFLQRRGFSSDVVEDIINGKF